MADLQGQELQHYLDQLQHVDLPDISPNPVQLAGSDSESGFAPISAGSWLLAIYESDEVTGLPVGGCVGKIVKSNTANNRGQHVRIHRSFCNLFSYEGFTAPEEEPEYQLHLCRQKDCQADTNKIHVHIDLYCQLHSKQQLLQVDWVWDSLVPYPGDNVPAGGDINAAPPPAPVVPKFGTARAKKAAAAPKTVAKKSVPETVHLEQEADDPSFKTPAKNGGNALRDLGINSDLVRKLAKILQSPAEGGVDDETYQNRKSQSRIPAAARRANINQARGPAHLNTKNNSLDGGASAEEDDLTNDKGVRQRSSGVSKNAQQHLFNRKSGLDTHDISEEGRPEAREIKYLGRLVNEPVPLFGQNSDTDLVPLYGFQALDLLDLADPVRLKSFSNTFEGSLAAHFIQSLGTHYHGVQCDSFGTLRSIRLVPTLYRDFKNISYKVTSNRDTRELEFLCECFDCLLSGQPDKLSDILTQRVKTIVSLFTDLSEKSTEKDRGEVLNKGQARELLGQKAHFRAAGELGAGKKLNFV